MKKLVMAVAVAVLAGWLLMPSAGFSTADMGKKEGKTCNICHAMPPKKDNLNAVGKCYLEKKDFNACKDAK